MTADGRHKRFERWVGEYGAMVSRIASTYEARPVLAEELVQESFMGLWRALPGFARRLARRRLWRVLRTMSASAMCAKR